MLLNSISGNNCCNLSEASECSVVLASIIHNNLSTEGFYVGNAIPELLPLKNWGAEGIGWNNNNKKRHFRREKSAFLLVEWFYFLPHWKVKKFWNEDFKPRKMSLLLGKNWLGQTPIKKSTEDSRMPCERDWSSILFFEIREFQEWGILRMSCNCLDAPIPL